MKLKNVWITKFQILFLKYLHWILSRWGSSTQLGLWYGLDGSFQVIGIASCFVASPFIAQITTPLSAWVSVFFALIAALCGFGIAIIDYFLSRLKKQQNVEKKMEWWHIKKIQPSVWIVYVILMTLSANYQTFMNIASDLFQETGHRFSPTMASRIASIGPFFQIFLSPYFGWFSDRHGSSLILILIACTVMCLSYIGLIGNVLGMNRCSVLNSYLLFEINTIFNCISIHFFV